MISGKVIGKEIDQKGNIKVTTEYTLKSGEKIVGNTRYAQHNYSRDNVTNDIKKHCETLMKKLWVRRRNNKLFGEVNLDNLEYECSQCEVITKPPVLDEEGNVLIEGTSIIITDED